MGIDFRQARAAELPFPFLLTNKPFLQFCSPVVGQSRLAAISTRLSPGRGALSTFSSVAGVGSGNRHFPAANRVATGMFHVYIEIQWFVLVTYWRISHCLFFFVLSGVQPGFEFFRPVILFLVSLYTAISPRSVYYRRTTVYPFWNLSRLCQFIASDFRYLVLLLVYNSEFLLWPTNHGKHLATRSRREAIQNTMG